MVSRQDIEAADRLSRKRPVLIAAAAGVFLLVQVIVRPVYAGGAQTHLRLDWWAANAAALVLMLATGGGWLSRREVRALVNDEVARRHHQGAAAAGYWTAMIAAAVVYAVSPSAGFDARAAVYYIVTPSIGLALLYFAWLEWRAHRDG
jgi:hypothetical protein